MPPGGWGGQSPSPDISEVEDFENAKKKYRKNFSKSAEIDIGRSRLMYREFLGLTIVRYEKNQSVEDLEKILSVEVIEKMVKSSGV